MSFAIQAKAQDINFVAKFESDFHNLLNVLGKTDVEVMANGTALKTYKSSGSLSTDDVEEKGLIPDSQIAMGDATIVELTYRKYRNLVSIEQIGKKGYDVAVSGANNELLKQVVKSVRKSLIGSLSAAGIGTATASDFQAKIAKAAAYVEKAFEDEACTPVFFVNPDDAYEYLGSHAITVENASGLSYLENFMGIGNVVIDSNVPAGTVYGTATENIVVAAADVAGIQGLEMTTDAAGMVAVHSGALYQNGAIETVCYSGIACVPAIADRIVAVTAA